MPSAVPNKKLVDWIAKRRTDLTEVGLISRFELWHVEDGALGERLGLYEMETRDDDEDPEDLVQEIWSDAIDDSQTRPQGTFQRYVVKAYRGESHEPDESKAFNLTGASVSGYSSGSESPSQRGLMAQEMRMSDNLHGMMMRMAEGSSGQLAKQLEEAREREATLLMQRSRLLEIEQRLLDRSHEREMDKIERAKSAERMDMMLGMVTNLAPLLLSKLFEGKSLPGPIGAVLGAAGGMMGGGEPGSGSQVPGSGSGPDPEPRTPDPAAVAAHNRVRRVLARDEGIGHLLSTLNGDQVSALAGILRPDQAMGFMQIYQDFRDESQERGTQRTDSHGSEETH
jgi:hypothetical protein